MSNQKHALKAIADMRSMVASHLNFNAAPSDSAAEMAAFDQGESLYEEVAQDYARTMFAMSGLAMALLALLEVETIFTYFDTLEEACR